jgi:hypothetical protein
MEEFKAYGMYPLAAGVGFDRVTTCETLVSKLKVSLPKFVVILKDEDEDDVQFLVRVELEVEGIVGSYTKPEHDACLRQVRNDGQLNRVFELVGVAYGPRLVPGTEVARKRKLDAIGKDSSKRPKVAGKKKVETTKVAPSHEKTGLKRPSAMEVASAKPLKQSKKATTPPATVVAYAPSGALGSKVAVVAYGSKGMASVKKMAVPIHKWRVPSIGVMTGASSKES